MITRWPYCVPDRHAGKITIYGWGTSPIGPVTRRFDHLQDRTSIGETNPRDRRHIMKLRISNCMS